MLERNLKVLQINVNRSSPATEGALEYARDLKIDLIAVQEPWIITSNNDNDYRRARSVTHPSYNQIVPNPTSPSTRPRTLLYYRRDLGLELVLKNLGDSDLQSIDIIDRGSQLTLLNIYNERDENNNWTIDRTLYKLPISNSTVLLGDFNIHHPIWEPSISSPSPRARLLKEWLDDKELNLSNNIGEETFFRPHLDRGSVLDLTFTRGVETINWQTTPNIGSDHLGITFTIKGSKDSNCLYTTSLGNRFNTKKADWTLFDKTLKEQATKGPYLTAAISTSSIRPEEILEGQTHPIIEHLDQAASALTKAIQLASVKSIPLLRISPKSKPWWNDKLKDLRKAHNRAYRALRRCPKHLEDNSKIDEHKEHYKTSRNTYFQAVKAAKQDHWNRFLEGEDPTTIFKAMSYTKDNQKSLIPTINGQSSFKNKCEALRTALFPNPPTTSTTIRWKRYTASPKWKWPKLSTKELCDACSSIAIKGKTPGPDSITQEIIARAYAAIPEVFYNIYSSLLDIGVHPKAWKQAIGAILKKPGKPDYSIPKAYRVISLLNCLGKVSERILARRLGYLAETTDLLHPSQLGGRRKKSAIDAAFLLTDEVQANKGRGLKTSTLFLDIKGAFDHVAREQLLGIMHRLRLPASLILWTRSFLSDRTLKLSFNGNIEDTKPIDTGIPQGSPISPTLFLIYIRDLFLRLEGIKPLSYVDDIALTAASTSLRKNVKLLERATRTLYTLGQQNAIEFDLAKTELLHFTKGKGSEVPITLPNNEVIKPSRRAVRWLGIWFDPHLTFKEHIRIRASQARQAFSRLERLAYTGRGLSARALRQLYRACIISIADYGSPIWSSGSVEQAKPLQAIQNAATKKILGVFKTAPSQPCEVETSLLPPLIRLTRSRHLYALRCLQLQQQHPINIRIDAIRASNRSSKPTQLQRIIEDLDQLDKDDLYCYTTRFDPYSKPPWSDPKEPPKSRGPINRRQQLGEPRLPKTTPTPTQARTLIIRLINNQAVTEWTTILDKYKTKQMADPKGNPLSYSRLYDWKLSLHPSLGPQGISRQINSAFFQLKLGHGYLKGYLNKLGRTDNNLCRCLRKETPRHLLLECRLYREERKEFNTLSVQPLTLPLLLHTSEGGKLTRRFIEATRIATRGWHLSRLPREEEEDTD